MTPIEAALLEAIETRLANVETLLRVQQGLLQAMPARLAEAPAYVCARCNRKIKAGTFNVREGLYYHVTCTPVR